MQEPFLTPSSLINELKKNKVTHVVWLPDSETNFMYNKMAADPEFLIIPVCREGEAMAVAAGLWVGGAKPVVLIQNTGLFESGDSIRGINVDMAIPMVMLVGYRGWKRHGIITDSAAKFTEPMLETWGFNYHLIETDEDVNRISTAYMESEKNQSTVVCLLGAEYTDQE